MPKPYLRPSAGAGKINKVFLRPILQNLKGRSVSDNFFFENNPLDEPKQMWPSKKFYQLLFQERNYCASSVLVPPQREDRGRGSARMRFKFSINKKMVSAARIRADAVRVRGPPSGLVSNIIFFV